MARLTINPEHGEYISVRAQNVHDYWMAHCLEHGWDNLGSFTCARPPFPRMLVTYTHSTKKAGQEPLTKEVHISVTERTVEEFRAIFELVNPVDEDGTGKASPMEFHDFLMSVPAEIVVELRCAILVESEAHFVPGRWYVVLDQSGQVLTHKKWGWVFLKTNDDDKALRELEVSSEDVSNFMGRHGSITLATLQFMNCRNVEIIDNPPSRQQRRYAERHGEKPPVTYKTLRILPVRRKRGVICATRPGEPGHELSLHIRIGHFKDYRKSEKGLGKYHTKGVWWWAPTVLGNESAGKIVKDYEVVVKGDE